VRKLLLVLVAVVAFARPAWPQANAGAGKAGTKDYGQVGIQIQGQAPGDSIRRNIGATSNGLWTYDVGVVWEDLKSNAINNSASPTAPGAAGDSSAMYDVSQARQVMLYLYPVVQDSAGLWNQTLYLQIRTGNTAGNDSSTTFPLIGTFVVNSGTQVSASANIAARVDTVSLVGLKSLTGPLPGERVLILPGNSSSAQGTNRYYSILITPAPGADTFPCRYMGFRLRPGALVYNSGVTRTVTTTMIYRLDARLSR